MKLCVALLLLGGCYPVAYMQPVIEFKCPVAITDEACGEAISRGCHGASYVIVISEHNQAGRTYWVSCEAEK